MCIVSKHLMHLKLQDTTGLMAYHVIANLQMYAGHLQEISANKS